MNIGDLSLYGGALIGLGFASLGAAPVVKNSLYDNVTPIIEVHSVVTTQSLVGKGAVVQPRIRYTKRAGCIASQSYTITARDARADGSTIIAALGRRAVKWPPGEHRAVPDVLRLPDWLPAGRYRVALTTTGRCRATRRSRATSPDKVVTNRSEPFLIEIVNDLSEIPDPPRFSTSNAKLGETRLPHISQ